MRIRSRRNWWRWHLLWSIPLPILDPLNHFLQSKFYHRHWEKRYFLKAGGKSISLIHCKMTVNYVYLGEQNNFFFKFGRTLSEFSLWELLLPILKTKIVNQRLLSHLNTLPLMQSEITYWFRRGYLHLNAMVLL